MSPQHHRTIELLCKVLAALNTIPRTHIKHMQTDTYQLAAEIEQHFKELQP